MENVQGAGKAAIPIFFDNFNVSRKIIVLNSLNNHAALMYIASIFTQFHLFNWNY